MADVADTLAEWSSTTASNAPSGATTIGTGLDDNLREIQGVITRGLSHKGADISATGTPSIGDVEGLMHDIVGTTTITGLGTVRAGIWKILKFESATPLIHNATSLILPGAANITTADGDVGIFFSEGSGNWRCVDFSRAAISPSKIAQITFGTPVTASGASVTFSSIPSGVRQITIAYAGLSTNGTSQVVARAGTSGGVAATGYLSASVAFGSTTSAALTSGFALENSGSAATIFHGQVVLTRVSADGTVWSASWMTATSNAAEGHHGAGSVTLGAELDRVSLTTVGGTDTFDAGTINVVYLQ